LEARDYMPVSESSVGIQGMSSVPKHPTFRAGDRVIVRSPEEILATLDADGTLDGMPFMPEMLNWCGKSFRVDRRAEKTCVVVPPPEHANRRFAANDAVFLDELRCDGRAHDGCKRGCKFFWKEDWLRPDDSADTSTRAFSRAEVDELLARLKTKLDENRYFCQSTQLFKATEAFPGNKKLWTLRIMLREVRNGDRSVPEILRLLVLWFWQRALRAVHGDQWLCGPHERAPVVSLNLQPGESVRIKSRPEMEATLDHKRTNRGLMVCYEMTRCCGGQAEVRDRVDRMIDERTGQMLEIRNTVTLRNVRKKGTTMPDSQCLCWNETGDCPRGELMYWREIWLERANAVGHEQA
jgi:hypothetical protein